RSPLPSLTRLLGEAPLVPLKEARVVMVLLPAATSNTVPSLLAPPAAVVPKRAPLLSFAKPRVGAAWVPWVEAGGGVVLLPAATSNTVPSLLAPPALVVPKRSPLLSIITPATGRAPLVPLKEARVVMALLPAATSNTVPTPPAPPSNVVPKRSPLL